MLDRDESGGLVLVDFCSGGGHLGIVLAHLLKDENATVCLVENKEESLRRAHRRVKLLGKYILYIVLITQSELNFRLQA